jgi:hypothetical protein
LRLRLSLTAKQILAEQMDIFNLNLLLGINLPA